MVRYKLNKDAIMKAVNCSTRTFREVTQKTREDLIESRDFAIEELAVKGVSHREIVSRTGVPKTTVTRVIEEMNQGGPKRHDAKIAQPVVTPEDHHLLPQHSLCPKRP